MKKILCEREDSILNTIDFAIKLKCDFASFNVFVPKIDTLAGKEFLERIPKKNIDWTHRDQYGIVSITNNGVPSTQEMSRLLLQ